MVVNHREVVSGITHLFAAICALFGLFWLMTITRNNPAQMSVMFLYGLSLVVLYTASARLHLSQGTNEVMVRLRKFDHAAIYFAIGGTYTPLIVLLIDGIWQWIILIVIWAICLFGIYWKLSQLQGENASTASTVIYVLVGWFAVLCAPLWLPQVDETTLILIISGGIVYSIGAVIFALERPNLAKHFGFHELWHILVMIASLLHFIAISRLVII